MKKLLITVLLSLIIGCAGKGEDVKYSANDDFKVQYLFTCENIKVYRFFDGGHYHYFSIGKGKLLNDIVTVNTGKSSYTYDSTVINTGE
jgi:hypothetical protein